MQRMNERYQYAEQQFNDLTNRVTQSEGDRTNERGFYSQQELRWQSKIRELEAILQRQQEAAQNVDNQKEELLNSIQRMNQEIAKTQEEVVADRRAKEQLEKEKADILIAGESEIAQLRQVIEHLLAEG